MVTSEIKNAISEILTERINRNNGVSSFRANPKNMYMLYQNNIKITSECVTSDKVLQGDKVLAVIAYRYAARKVNGFYKMLKPEIKYL